MITIVNNFLDKLFNTHIISLYFNTDLIFDLDIGKTLIIGFILEMCIIIAFVGLWFFHQIFER